MPAFAHTPYDGSKKPFSIGLTPISQDDWIEADARLVSDIEEKRKLFAEQRDVVFAEEPETEAAQAEVLSLLFDHLPRRYPRLYRRDGDLMRIGPDGFPVDPAADEPALMTAARLVQEDLLVMRPGDAAGYRLVAAALCFPSAWSLREKFGTSLDGLHEHVPGYAGQMATRMKRVFDALKPDMLVSRLNWSIYPDASLHHPGSLTLPRDWFGIDRDAFIRVERQTLRRLPTTGDILFTVKILVDPFEAFAAHPDGPRLAAGLRTQLLALDPDQLRYKNLAAHRDAIADELARIAGIGAETAG